MIDAARLDDTNDPSRRSWVSSANHPDGDFPIQNLPFGVFRRRGSCEAFRGGVAIGDQILDLAALASSRLFHGAAAIAARCGRPLDAQRFDAAWSRQLECLARSPVRGVARRLDAAAGISRLSRASSGSGIHACRHKSAISPTSTPPSITPRPSARLFRPDNPLTPNYRWMPIGYHGRSSSIGVSGQRFHRPLGQRLRGGTVATGSRSEHASGLRTRVGGVPGNRQRGRKPDLHRRCGIARVWSVFAQRLVGARYSGVGIPAAGPFSGEELCDHHFALDRFLAGIGALSSSFRAWCGRTRTARLSRGGVEQSRRRHRYSARSVSAERIDAGTPRDPAAAIDDEFSPFLLDGRATDRAPHHQRLQSARGRPPRHRNAIRSDAGRSRLTAGIDQQRQAAHPHRFERTTDVSGRRGHRDAARLVREMPEPPGSASARRAVEILPARRRPP